MPWVREQGREREQQWSSSGTERQITVKNRRNSMINKYKKGKKQKTERGESGSMCVSVWTE